MPQITISPNIQLMLNTATDSNESGTTVWEGGVALARHMVAGKSAIDLGSGTGIVGIAIARLGAQTTVLTDIAHPTVLSLLEKNVRQNVVSTKPFVDTNSGDASDAAEKKTTISDITNTRVCALEWSSPAVIPAEIEALKPFDFVVGADVVYSMESVVKLVDTIDALTDRKTDVWIGHEHRDPSVSDHFLTLMKEKGFKSRNVKRQNLFGNVGGGEVDFGFVALYRFKRG
ncbi:hypothetical protein HK100_000906 [Physocladia obscura]|uniref:Uncharacterized protein n=1 Tax=Physocladia obscura TaxID=109957 RepID=A0AAD5SXT0_9FUNG|nr:hypothetical protein HK100_000906 [Physocladia obscura]